MRWLSVPAVCTGTIVALTASCSHPPQVSNAYARLDLPAGQPFCSQDGPAGERCAVSFISLIASPEKYAGRSISIIGFATLEFEGNALYLSKEAAEVGDPTSAVWLDVAGLELANPQTYDRKYVLIAGTFDAQNRGHLGMFAGTMRTISKIQLWRK